METVETRVPKSIFFGTKCARKQPKKLEKSSGSPMEPGCCEFESRHSERTRRFSAQKPAGFALITVQFVCGVFFFLPRILPVASVLLLELSLIARNFQK